MAFISIFLEGGYLPTPMKFLLGHSSPPFVGFGGSVGPGVVTGVGVVGCSESFGGKFIRGEPG